MTTIPTTETIELMKSAELVSAYNELAPIIGRPPVKKFETREIGIKRLIAVCDTLRAKDPAQRDAEPARAPGWDVVDTTAETVALVLEGTSRIEDPAEAAAAALRSGKSVKDAVREASPSKAPAKAAAPAKEKKPTIAARVRELVNQGLDNATIWKMVQPEFGIEDRHRGMVSWYRNDMLRRQKREAARAH